MTRGVTIPKEACMFARVATFEGIDIAERRICATSPNFSSGGRFCVNR